jgi:hypothetical protein
VTITPKMCGVTYDATGKVRSVTPIDPAAFHANPALTPGQQTVLDFSLVGQAGATSARAWLWFPDGSGVSRYLPLMTEAIPVN